MRTLFYSLGILALAIGSAPLRAQDDTARLREARIYAGSIGADTAGKGVHYHSFSYDNPRLTPSQGRTTTITYYTDDVSRILLIQTVKAVGQRIWQATYYLRQDSLLYATEEEIMNLKSGEDHGAIVWSAEYAFRNGKLVGLMSNGHGLSESDDWQPEVSVPADFNRARSRVVAHARLGPAAR